MINSFMIEGGQKSTLDPRFKLRMQAVSAYFASKGYDIEPTINTGINTFRRMNNFPDDYVDGRSAFHEIGHLAGNATSKSIADELRALIFELSYNSGLYSKKNPQDIPVYSTEKSSIKPNLKHQYYIYSLGRQMGATGYAYEKIAKAFLKSYLHSLIPFNTANQHRAIDRFWEYRIALADRDISTKEKNTLISRAGLKNEFFLALTGGRPLHALSTHELLNLSILVLGVTFNKHAKTASEICTQIPDKDLILMIKEFKANPNILEPAA